MRDKEHLLYLDGVRGLAATWVVLGHLWDMGRNVLPWPMGLAVNWMAYPHLAVDVFIVLSGYCLMMPVARNGDVLRPGFFRRRVRRILPPFYAALVASTALMLVIDRLGKQAETTVTVRSLLANALLLQDAFPWLNKINVPFWSVAVECKIYVLFPVLVFLWRRVGGWAAIGLACAVGYGLTFDLSARVGLDALQQACPWYLALFAFGMVGGWAAVHGESSRREAVAGVLLLGSAAAFVWLIGQYGNDPATKSTAAFIAHLPAIDTATGIAAAAALYLLGTRRGQLARRPLELRPIVAVGTIAYSIYLTHLPVLYVARIIAVRIPGLAHGSWAWLGVIGLIGLPIVAVVAVVFFRWFEQPFLSGRPRPITEEAMLAAASPAP